MSDIGYIRDGRIPAGQQLVDVTLDKLFSDTKDTFPEQKNNCDEFLRKGDTLHIHCIEVVANSPSDLYGFLDCLVPNGVKVKFHMEETAFTNDNENLISRFTLQCLKAHAKMDWALFKGEW